MNNARLDSHLLTPGAGNNIKRHFVKNRPSGPQPLCQRKKFTRLVLSSCGDKPFIIVSPAETGKAQLPINRKLRLAEYTETNRNA